MHNQVAPLASEAGEEEQPPAFIRDSYMRLSVAFHEGAKFGVVGALAFGITVGGANALRSGAHLSDLASVTISTVAATIFSFFGSKYWTFRLRKGSRLGRESALFFVFNGVGLLIQLAFVWTARHGLGLTDTFSYNVANTTGIAVATVFRLYSYRRWVFLAVVAGGAAPADRERQAATVLRRAGSLLADAGILAALLALTWWVGVRSTDFAGFLKGSDALDHAATVQLLMENFPHLLWNPGWFAGMPSVPGLYPPGYALMIAAVVTASGTSIQHAMVDCGVAAFLVMAASLYGFVRVIAKSRTAAALAGLLVLAVPAFWEPSLQSGEYPRLTAMAFGYLATFIAALYTVKPSRLRLTAAVAATGAALANHPITGGLGALQVVGVLLFVPYRPRRERLRTAGIAAALMTGSSAWLYLPSLIGVRAYYILPQAKLTPSTGTYFASLLYPGADYLKAFSPILLPLALLLTGIAAVVACRLRQGTDPNFGRALGSSAVMMIVVVCVLAYAYAGQLTHANVELVGIYPDDMFSYAAWPLAAASGVLVAGLMALLPKPRRRLSGIPAYAVPYAGAIACLVAITPILARDALVFEYEQVAHAEAPLLPGNNGTGQYRIGFTDQDEASYVFPSVPEIGGPFNQGAVSLDYIT